MPPAVIVRRARDWRRIIRVQSDARLGMQIREHRLQGDFTLKAAFFLAIKLKSKWSAEGRERSLGRIGFCSFKCGVVDFAREGPRPSPDP